MNDASKLLSSLKETIVSVAGKSISASDVAKLNAVSAVLGEIADMGESALATRFSDLPQIISGFEKVVSSAEQTEQAVVEFYEILRGKGASPASTAEATAPVAAS